MARDRREDIKYSLMIQNKKEDFEHNNKLEKKKNKTKPLRSLLSHCDETKNLQLCDENKKLQFLSFSQPHHILGHCCRFIPLELQGEIFFKKHYKQH